VATDVFKLLTKIYLSRGDRTAVQSLIDTSAGRPIDGKQIALTKAHLFYLKGDYLKVVEIYDALRKDDPTVGFVWMSPLSQSYLKTGQIDKAETIIKNEVDKTPNGAWTLGNYASFLLFYKRDIDGAIAAWEKALSIMTYGLGTRGLALAYSAKGAQKLHEADYDAARQYYGKAKRLGVPRETITATCEDYCSGISQLYKFVDAR